MRIDRFPFTAMACHCEIVIGYGETELSQSAVEDAVRYAIAEVHRIEYKYSRYRSDSVISQINRSAGKATVECDQETWNLLIYADNLYQSSQGLFDITAGVLRRAWNFSEAQLPSQTELADLCALINWRAVERDQQSIYLAREGMELDFGGFGKEYAADRAADLLRDRQVQFGYVNLGGDIRVIGPKPDLEAWQIGIQDPRCPDRLIARIPIERGALATSGDYQRFIEFDGRRYCHVLHPKTGWPVEEWRSITVVAPLATMAGSCTTIGMLMEKQGLEFLQKTGVNYFAIDKAGEIYKNH